MNLNAQKIFQSGRNNFCPLHFLWCPRGVKDKMQKIGEKGSISWNPLQNNALTTEDLDSITESGHLPYFGLPESRIQKQLEHYLTSDIPYESGKILGAMTQPGHPFARKIYAKYLGKNLGDPGLVLGSRRIEQEVIHILGGLLGNPFIQGNIVSGGTEANLIAMFLAKSIAQENDPDRFAPGGSAVPEVVLPESAHYSFDKAALLMGLKLRKARLREDYMPDMDHYASLINENTVALVGIAGTTALGMVDPLEKMGRLADKHGLFFHVDGAFGGLVLPFMKELGIKVPKFGFEINQINSYTVDPHKFAMGVNPTGAFLVQGSLLEDYQFMIPYLAGGGFKSFNILGTRPAAPALSFWALLQRLGKEGFLRLTRRAWDNTLYLYEQLQQIPEVEPATKPTMPVLGIKVTEHSPISCRVLDKKLRERGWALGYFAQWDLLRAVIMPYISRENIDEFIATLREIFA